ncbi:MAG: ABC transporter permease subunit, partial [Mesorhizobium sp.]
MAEARPIGRAFSPRIWLAGGWLLVLLLAAIFAPWVAPHDPLAQDLLLERLPPAWLPGSEPGFYLGTDSLGRDVLSRLIYGGRVAFTVAFVAASSTCLIGSMLGLIAGYFGGWADRIISRVVDIWMAFPPVLFAILLVA